MVYKKIDGHEAKRIIYTVFGTHNTSLYNSKSAEDAIEFMDTSFDVKTNLEDGNHIYPLKTASTLIGLITFFVFIVSFTLLLVQFEPISNITKHREAIMRISTNNKTSKIWLICLLAINTLFPIFSALLLFQIKLDKIIHSFFNQSMPLFYAVWGTVNALFVALTTYIWYQRYAKKNGISLGDIDLKISLKRFLQTFLLSAIVVAIGFALVFFIKSVFNVDFRFFQYSVRSFEFDRFVHALKLLPLFLVAYIVPSIFINCLNYNTTFGKNKKLNIIVLALLNVLAPVILATIGYSYFFATGTNTLFGSNNQIADWMVAPLFGLLVSPFVTRIIYEKTCNPYIGGIINGLIFGIITCVNSQIVFPS